MTFHYITAIMMNKSKNNILKIIICSIMLYMVGCCTLEPEIKYSKVKIQFNSSEQIKELALRGLIFDHSSYDRNKNGFTLTTVLDENEIEILSKSKLEFKILVQDLIKEYDDRNKSH